jgi:hypothetical protein
MNREGLGTACGFVTSIEKPDGIIKKKGRINQVFPD